MAAFKRRAVLTTTCEHQGEEPPGHTRRPNAQSGPPTWPPNPRRPQAFVRFLWPPGSLLPSEPHGDTPPARSISVPIHQPQVWGPSEPFPAPAGRGRGCTWNRRLGPGGGSQKGGGEASFSPPPTPHRVSPEEQLRHRKSPSEARRQHHCLRQRARGCLPWVPSGFLCFDSILVLRK